MKAQDARFRRRGQALLLAVVLMVFAALLGATFVTVISANLSQTARTGDKSEAIQAAQAGAEYARRQISQVGLQWRPKNDSAPPQPGDTAQFGAYFDAFDLAQGWATSGVQSSAGEAYHRDGFVKYPDPRMLNSDTRALHFMLKVEKIAPGDSDNSGDRTGDLRVSIIGRAADNAAAWHRIVLYKQGAIRNPLVSAMRTISNWDFQSGAVGGGEIAAYDNINFRATLRRVRGAFPAGGNCYAMIGDPATYSSTGNVPRSAIVQFYDAATATLQLTANPSPLPAVGERVDMAAGIGAPNFINYDNSSSISTTGTPGVGTGAGEFADFLVASAGMLGSVRANGGLYWCGDVKARALRSQPVATSSGLPFGALQCSGAMQIAPAVAPTTSSQTSAGTSSIKVAGTYIDRNGTTQTLPDSLLANDSSASNFPGAWTQGTTSLNSAEKSQLADDGWNAMSGTPSGERQIKAFTPPDITLGRYRDLTKSSAPASGYSGNAGLYGYGEGVYINNPEDVEKIGVAAGQFAPMSDAQFRQMLFDTTATAIYNHGGVPAVQSDNTKSLEEQHLRGWIGPDEFRARGAQVELNPDATITITLDSRDDSTSFNEGAAPHKCWRNPDGSSADGVYSRTISWPNSGVLFAEGNLRVRGVANNPPRSLTIVSMNNIYIEGSTGLATNNGTTRKLLLLATRNVILNPTGILSRPDNQTLLKVATAAGANTLSVADAAPFRVGDWIYVDIPATSNEPFGCIKAIDFANGILTLDRTVSAQSAGRVVRSETDPLTNATPSLVATSYNQVLRFRQALQRRFYAASAGDVRLALKHSAERRDALDVPFIQAVSPAVAATNVTLGFKLAANANTSLIVSSRKILDIASVSADPPANDLFGHLPVTSVSTPSSYSIRQLGGDTPPTAISVRGELRDRRLAPKWNYGGNTNSLVLNRYNLDPPLFPPYYFLAGVGNRKPNEANSTASNGGSHTASTTSPGREILFDVAGTSSTYWGASGYKIPMATSVVATMNSLNSYDSPDGALGIRNDTFDTTLNDWERVGQFGFNPIHGATTSTWNAEPEDVLTADQGFYTGSSTVIATLTTSGYTLDSRVLSRAQSGSNSLALRFNNRVVDGTNGVDRFFDSTGSLATMPYYRLARIKFENLNQFNAARVFENVTPALSVEVNAYVYAQEGSWLVISGDYFDPKVVNSNTAASSDLNRDGVLSRGEKVAAHRFHRYNYKINFLGAICENHTAIINSSGAVVGAVADWMDKWAATTLGAANFDASNNPINVSWNRGNFGNISYGFDDSAARGLLDDDAGFRLPVSETFDAQS